MRAIFFVIAFTLLLEPVGARLYKWVDANGTVHYSDSLPPEAVIKPHEKLDKRGLVIERTGRAKTPEEIAREQELKRLREKQQRLLEEQKAKDKVLLNTFRTEDDIILARDGKLATYDAQIRIAYANIERLKAWLETQKKKAAAQERKGKQVPAKLLAEIKNTRQQIKANYESILRQERDKEFIRKKYAADLARFRELKALKRSSQEEEQDTSRARSDAIVETVIVCDDKIDCEATWKQAKAYARKYATTRTYVDTNKMFMTQPPKKKEDLSITVSRLRPEANKPEIIFLDVACVKQVASETWCETEAAKRIRTEFRQAVTRNK